MYRRIRFSLVAALATLIGPAAFAQSVLQDIGMQPTMNRVGEATQAEGGAGITAANGAGAANPSGTAAENSPTESAARLLPFGADLFTTKAPALTETANPNYRIQPGDQISIHAWGGITLDTITAVDQDGNIFLPTVGPLHVGGVRSADLQSTVQNSAERTFTDKVNVYAVLVTTHQVGVYVTGFVNTPGRFGGIASDSVLDYLVRAGGIDPSRGSFRDILVKHDNVLRARVDLYDFLISGHLPDIDLAEGDTILVERQHPTVAVGGAVRNNFLFELPSGRISGAEIVALARPLPDATHALIRGTRDDQPYSAYLTLNEFASARLADQDQITFVMDHPTSSITVEVQGSRIGPSVLVADRTTTLPQLLNYVAVNSELADTKSVYILRPGLADLQKRAMQEATDRLERSLVLAISSTTGVAQIRASEAQMITSYLQRAREIQPEGRLVVTDPDGSIANIRLEDQDVIVIPEKSQLVLVTGEVMIPQAVIVQPGYNVADYVARAGGFTERGRKGHYMIRHANGGVDLDSKQAPVAGDQLIILPYIDTKFFQMGVDFMQVAYQIALSAAVVRNN